MKHEYSAARCAAPLDLETQVAYWLGELDAAREAAVDEHLLGCGHCSTSLQSLVEIAGGIRALVRQGAVRAVVTDAFVQRLTALGLRVREDRVPQNGSVHCSVAPDDDILVARLQAPLADVEQVDLVMLDADRAEQQRMRDIPFNPAAGEIALASRIELVRPLGETTVRIRMVAVERGGERVIGEYTLLHSPWRGE
jgi:hypothetical protein